MHGAPSVSYPVGRCRLAATLAAALWLLGGVGIGLWALQSAVTPAILAAATLAWACAGAIAARSWMGSPTGELRWTGEGWLFAGQPAGAPVVAADLQGWLLVRQRIDGREAWLWLERGRGADWDALRRAVYSRASTSVLPARPPVASP